MAVALAAPANVSSPYLLQDLAYQSVDADEDGQPDAAVTVTHPVAQPYYAPYAPFAYYGAPTVAVAAKSEEKPAEVKALPLAAPYGYAPYGLASYGTYAPYAAPTFGYSFVTHA